MTRARANGHNQLVTKQRDRSADDFTDERNEEDYAYNSTQKCDRCVAMKPRKNTPQRKIWQANDDCGQNGDHFQPASFYQRTHIQKQNLLANGCVSGLVGNPRGGFGY